MTRFHFTLLAALLLTITVWALGNWILLWVTAGVFLALVALGVTLPQMQFFGPFICRGRKCSRCVALTFDDGPDVRSTPALLDALREAGLPAAFFCIGKHVAENPNLATRIANEGHLIANHSYTHSNATNFFSVPRLTEELTKTQAAIREATGTSPRWYRPPIGLSNPRTFRAAQGLGLTVVGWTAGGLDTLITDPEKIVKRILKRLRPGAIILLHDGNVPTERLIATVKLLLDSLRKLDYQVVRLDQLLA